jgi:hypothetical protein
MKPLTMTRTQLPASVLLPRLLAAGIHGGLPHMQLGRFLTALVGAGFRVATAEPAFDKPLPGKEAAIRWPCTGMEE